MKLKIVSKGSPENTYVVNAATGERIENVKSAKWDNGVAVVEVWAVALDVTAEAEVITATTDPDLEETLDAKPEDES